MLARELLKIKIEESSGFADELWESNQIKNGFSVAGEHGYSTIVATIKILFGVSNQKIIKEKMVIDGNKDGGIDAIFIDKNTKIINILDVKKNENFDRKDILNNLVVELDKNFFNPNTDLSSLNKLASKKIAEAGNLYRTKDYSVKIFVIRLLRDNSVDEKLKENVSEATKSWNKVEFLYLNLHDIVNKVINKSENSDFSENITFANDSSFYDSINKVVVGKLKLVDLLNLLDKADDEEYTYNLTEDNVREYQEDSFFVDSLRDTIKDSGGKFFLFHNGITISCSLLESKDGRYSFTITNPQIINGCQSVMAIKKLFSDKNKRKKLDDCFILCRFFEAKNSDEVNYVCQTTNTQRKIETWDLRVNDSIQKIIEEVMLVNGYNYNRKKRKGSNKGKILITDLAQWIYACKKRKPAEAKSAKKSLFNVEKMDESLYWKQIFNDDLTIEVLDKICRACLFVESEIKSLAKNEDSKLIVHANFHIMTFLYNYGELNTQSFLNGVNLCKLAAKEIRKEKGQDYSPNNIFKNDNTWSVIERLVNTNK